MEQTNKFRSSSNSRLLKALFYETTGADKATVVYTLKDSDHLGYPSLYRLYMETDDPTEYRFATQHLDGWEHWQQLCECTWFVAYADRWRHELEVRMKSKALARIMTEAKTGGRDSFASNKYLLEKGWEPKEQAKRGRPSKAEIKEEAHKILSTSSRLEEDFFRITGKTN
jgi:hypothetical protein